MFSQLQGAGLALSPRSSPHSGRASGTLGDDTSHNPKAAQHVRGERGVSRHGPGERGQGMCFLVTFCVCFLVSLA